MVQRPLRYCIRFDLDGGSKKVRFEVAYQGDGKLLINPDEDNDDDIDDNEEEEEDKNLDDDEGEDGNDSGEGSGLYIFFFIFHHYPSISILFNTLKPIFTSPIVSGHDHHDQTVMDAS